MTRVILAPIDRTAEAFSSLEDTLFLSVSESGMDAGSESLIDFYGFDLANSGNEFGVIELHKEVKYNYVEVV